MILGDFTTNRDNRRLIYAFGLNAIGNGMTMSLLIVYMHDLRGFSYSFGGLVLAVGSAISLLFGGPTGALIDRIGPKKVTVGSILFLATGAASWAFITTQIQAFIAMSLICMAGPALWGGNNVMLTRLTPPEERHKIFGLNFMALNVGIGLGGLIASAIIQENNLRSFQIMYLLDALTYLGYLVLLFTIKNPKIDAYVPEDGEEKKGSYIELFRNREIVYFVFAGLILMIFGYGPLQAGIPVFVTEHLELSPKWLGLIYGANTISIVLFQPLVLRLLEKRSKYRALLTVGAIWSLSWVVIALSNIFIGLIVAGVIVAISQIVFAVGEMIWSPTAPALLNEISPEHMRGRANALNGLQWGIAGVVGPAMAGLMLGHGWAMQWVYLMGIGALLPIPLFAAMHHYQIRTRSSSDLKS